MKSEPLEVSRGSGNVFRDLGQEDADLKQFKALLAAEILKALDRDGLTVRATHARTGIAAADFSTHPQCRPVPVHAGSADRDHQPPGRARASRVEGPARGGCRVRGACGSTGASMMDAILTVERWGNWLALRLPENVARAARLTANQRVRITGERGRIVIAPHAEQRLSLLDRLALFDPAVHGGEPMPTTRVGREAW